MPLTSRLIATKTIRAVSPTEGCDPSVQMSRPPWFAVMQARKITSIACVGF